MNTTEFKRQKKKTRSGIIQEYAVSPYGSLEGFNDCVVIFTDHVLEKTFLMNRRRVLAVLYPITENVQATLQDDIEEIVRQTKVHATYFTVRDLHKTKTICQLRGN